MDDVQIHESLDEQIASSLQAAQNAPVNEKLRHLKKTEELLLDREGGAHLVDNFLDEMLEFAELPNPAIKIFVLSFIEKACKKDAEVMKKAIHTLYRLLMTENESKSVIKKAMLTCMNIYSILLRWAVQRKSDPEVESCWDKFSTLKGRIMFHIDSENEGIRTRAIKFLEMVVLAQSTGNDKADEGPRRLMSLGEIPRDHRFISYRKMTSEAQHSMQSLIDQTSLPHISSQNLLTVLCALCNIARQRPEFLSRVVDAIDVLQVNLPPTLGTSQVKAVRKELKMHLIRLMKLPSIVPHVNKISTLLSDLGASQAEIQKVMPAEAKRKPTAPLKDDEPAMKKRRDLPGTSSAVMDDDEEEEDEDVKKERVTMDSAIDVTQNYIFSRLNHKVVTNLVLISLATLPDVMPPAFQSTFTPIASAGSEEQRMRLSRMMATQANSRGIGPGAEMLKEQKLRAIQERAVARNEGALIPPTPVHFLKTEKGKLPAKRLPARVNVPLPPPTAIAPKSKVQTNIVSSCKEMTTEERDRLFMITLERLMDTERRAQQGGAAQAQHKILVRLVSRFQEKNDILEDKLVEFIIAQHKSRSELALLWVAEMYAQYQGFTLCFAKSHDDGRLTQPERLARYNKVLVLLLRRLFERELHKETVFHKILLEAPLLTPDALSFLKLACTDPVFHPFAIMTLRELVLSRSRQRSELLQLLFHLTFYEKVEIRTQSVETVKELFELPYMKNCVRSEVESQLEDCTKEYPPPHFIVEEGRNVWSAALFKAALTLPLATLIHDHSLIHLMAKVFAKSTNNDFKLAIMRQIDNSVKSMGQGSEELLKLLEECPQGAESFVARIVHLLTERAPATPEIVHRLKKLHDSRQTDVRSLLPILPGLSKEDILILLPKFVIHSTMAKSFGQAAKRILSTKNSESGQYSITPTELIVEYHRINATTPDEKKLLKEHVRTVLTAHRSITKEIISSAIEELLRVNPVPQLLFHTIVVVYELHNHLHAFLSNVLHKLITRELWKENGEYEKDFLAAIVAMPDVSYQVALTKLGLDDLKRLMESTNEVDVGRLLKNALPTLSTHQQKEVSDEVLELIGVSERPCEVRERERKRDQKERDERREKEGSRVRDNRGDKTDRRRGEREEKKGERSSRRSYAIGEHR